MPKKEGRFRLPIGKLQLQTKPKKILLLIGGLLATLGLFVFLFSLIKGTIRPSRPSSSPTPTPTISEDALSSPSAYATDSAILKIGAELNLIEEKLNVTDLKEAGLNPPVLDMEIEFEE